MSAPAVRVLVCIALWVGAVVMNILLGKTKLLSWEEEQRKTFFLLLISEKKKTFWNKIKDDELLHH